MGLCYFYMQIVENEDSNMIHIWMSINEERELECNLRPVLLKQNCSWVVSCVGLVQSMCSSLLILPPLLLQEDSKHLPQHKFQSVIILGLLKFNSDSLLLRVDKKM